MDSMLRLAKLYGGSPYATKDIEGFFNTMLSVASNGHQGIVVEDMLAGGAPADDYLNVLPHPDMRVGGQAAVWAAPEEPRKPVRRAPPKEGEQPAPKEEPEGPEVLPIDADVSEDTLSYTFPEEMKATDMTAVAVLEKGGKLSPQSQKVVPEDGRVSFDRWKAWDEADRTLIYLYDDRKLIEPDGKGAILVLEVGKPNYKGRAPVTVIRRGAAKDEPAAPPVQPKPEPKEAKPTVVRIPVEVTDDTLEVTLPGGMKGYAVSYMKTDAWYEQEAVEIPEGGVVQFSVPVSPPQRPGWVKARGRKVAIFRDPEDARGGLRDALVELDIVKRAEGEGYEVRVVRGTLPEAEPEPAPAPSEMEEAEAPVNLMEPLAGEVARRRWQMPVVVWDPREFRNYPGFFELAVKKAGATAVWFSGSVFLNDLTERERKEVLKDAREAGLRAIGFIDGDPSWPAKPAEVKEFYRRLTSRLLELNAEDVGDLEFQFVTDVEMHTRRDWNGKLGPYFDLLNRAIIPQIIGFSKAATKRYGRNPVVGTWLYRFEPESYRAKPGDAPPDHTTLAGMTYHDTGSAIEAGAQRFRDRAQEEGTGTRHMFTVEFQPASRVGGSQLTFHGQERLAPSILLGVCKQQADAAGLILHFGSVKEADAGLRKMTGTPARASRPGSPDVEAPQGPAVTLRKVELRADDGKLSLTLEGVPDGALASAWVENDLNDEAHVWYIQPRAYDTFGVKNGKVVLENSRGGDRAFRSGHVRVVIVKDDKAMEAFIGRLRRETEQTAFNNNDILNVILGDRDFVKDTGIVVIEITAEDEGEILKAGREGDSPDGSTRRDFLGTVGGIGLGLALGPPSVLAQAEKDPAKAAAAARVRGMVDQTYYNGAVQFVDRQRIAGRPRVKPGGAIPEAKRAGYRRARGMEFRGFDLNGLYQSYRPDPSNPHWEGPEGAAPIAQYGRVWIYDTSLGIKADIGAIQVDSAAKRSQAAGRRLQQVRAAVKALVELGKDEEALGFEGGWHFSYNTDGDNWMDPRAPMGSTLWGINAIYGYVGFVLGSSEDAELRREALAHLAWVNNLVQRLVFSMQVMDPADPRDGLIRNMVYNSLIDEGMSLDDAGYRPYEGQINRKGEHAIFEHNADLVDVYRNAAQVNDLAGTVDERFRSARFKREFRDKLPERHERVLNALWEKGWVGDHFVTAMEPDGTLNTSVAIDNNTWVAGVFLPYDEDRVWESIDYVWNEFRTRGRDGNVAQRAGDLVLDDVPATGHAALRKHADKEIAAVYFFGQDFKDPYVDVPADRRHKLVELIQPEATEGYRDLLIRVALTTQDPERREEALRRAELITETLKILREIYGGLPYATRYIPDLMSTLQGMAAEGSTAVVSARAQGARVDLIGADPPADFTFQGRKSGEAAPPGAKPLPKPKPEVEPKPEAPAELGAAVVGDLKAGTLTLQLDIPEDLQGKSLVAIAFVKTDIWYPQPSLRPADAIKKVSRKNGQVTLTTNASRSPFIGGKTVGRAVAVFESAKKAEEFLKAYETEGYRAVNDHAVRVFLIDEEKKVTATDRLAFRPAVDSIFYNLTSSRGPMVHVGPSSPAFLAAQRPADPELLARASVPTARDRATAGLAEVGAGAVAVAELPPEMEEPAVDERLARGGWALGSVQVSSVKETVQGHILYNDATLAALFFLHVPDLRSPNVAVVDPLRLEQLRAIAASAGFSRDEIEAWEDQYVVPYNPEIRGDVVERATQVAKARIATLLGQSEDEFEPLLVFRLSEVLSEFGLQLEALLKSFGFTLQNGALDNRVLKALYEAAQA